MWKSKNIKEECIYEDVVAHLLNSSANEVRVLVDKFKKTNCIYLAYPMLNEGKYLYLKYRYYSLFFNMCMGYKIFFPDRTSDFYGTDAWEYKKCCLL